MKNHSINIHAVRFAQRVGGTTDSFRGLLLIIYGAGSIPALAVWEESQIAPTADYRFLDPAQRDRYIEQLLSEQRRPVLWRFAQRLKCRVCQAATSVLP